MMGHKWIMILKLGNEDSDYVSSPELVNYDLKFFDQKLLYLDLYSNYYRERGGGEEERRVK